MCVVILNHAIDCIAKIIFFRAFFVMFAPKYIPIAVQSLVSHFPTPLFAESKKRLNLR